jgi:Ca2+-binding EF-hand superfamily protein
VKLLAIVSATALALAAAPAISADKDNDPGFNKLDKNNDGYITPAEAKANPHLAKNFKQADKNTDGKLNRAEYLWVMTKKDVGTATSKVEKALQNKEDKPKSQSSAGGTK